MKRCFGACLIICLLLSGCTLGERLKEPANFFYLRCEYQYFSQNGVIASEERETSGHRNDLSYLMALYLMGPADEEMVSPLPKGTRILKAEQDAEGVILQLSDLDSVLSDTDFSLACACLSLTCFELTDSQSVTINSGERSVTMERGTLSLYDGSTAAQKETQ